MNSSFRDKFLVSGQARFTDSAEQRALAASLASYVPADRYILFEFDIDRAASTRYLENRAVRENWTTR